METEIGRTAGVKEIHLVRFDDYVGVDKEEKGGI
jgi:hypothetical protein